MSAKQRPDYQTTRREIEPRVILAFKRIYVVLFNLYSWYWLYRQIFVRHSTHIEDYLLWFFTTFGMYVFVLEHQEIFFKKKQPNQTH